MKRRAALHAIAIGIVWAAWPSASAGATARVGFLSSGHGFSALSEAFRGGLKEVGYVEGTTVIVEWRFTGGRPDRLRAAARELIDLRVDVIVAASLAATHAAREETRRTPIVMAAGGDPIRAGVVASLARPGGNVTGLVAWSPEVSRNRLRTTKELVPSANRLALVWNLSAADKDDDVATSRAEATALGLQVDLVGVRTAQELPGAVADAAQRRVGALIVLNDALMIVQAGRIADLAAAHGLPVIHDVPELAHAGALAGYGPSVADLFRRAAAVVRRIVDGADPATLPVEPATRFDLVVNLATAQRLGLVIPPALLDRASRVIR